MKRSKFSLSHYKLLSMDQGELVPVGLTEVLPGDTIQQATSALIRVSPLLAPVMHPVHVRIHHWFVPHRLVWDSWEDFITGGPDGMDASVFPTVKLPAVGVGSLADYLGLPPGTYANPNELEVSALPFRGYQLIFNEWYRDQDLTAEAAVSTGSGVDTTTQLISNPVSWEKDYFTTARPWAQKGPDVTIPLAGSAPVVSNNQNVLMYGATTPGDRNVVGLTTGELAYSGAGYAAANNMRFGTQSGLEANLSGATDTASINELRLAFALQRYEEARARYGSRYTEYLRYLGVRSSDARLQRPEYLGGGKQTIQFSEVLQTGVTTDGDDSEGVGNLKGHGIGALRSNRYRRFFEEHGYIFTLMSVRPKTIYADGVHRTWNRRTKEDFFQKELQHIGQQEVLQKEIYAQGTNAQRNGVFGYQDRYDEYRRAESSVSGLFRTTLNFWHQARLFASAPALNGAFVQCVPTDRIYAAPEQSGTLWCMVNHSIQARRIVSANTQSFVY